MTKTENAHLRKLCRTAVDSGDFTSLGDLSLKAGLGSTTLYPFMNKGNGLGRVTAEALYPLIEKYKVPRDKRLTNGHLNGHTNGVAKKKLDDGFSGGARLSLAKSVLEELFSLYDMTGDEEVTARIDVLISSWAVQGLEVIASAARDRKE
jgi:hypothetical protein